MTAQPASPVHPPSATDPRAHDDADAPSGDQGIHHLTNPVRDYPWGSPSVIPALLGRPADGSPVAEMWMGAHPGAPSVLTNDPEHRDLGRLIGTDPDRLLGTAVSRRFDQHLPFLLKVLAAERNLSLQAHPSLEQAREGYARDTEAGLADDHPDRNYRDANHKPEQIVALSPFVGLCGFRPTRDTAAFLDALDVPALAQYRHRLVATGGVRDVVTALLTLPAPSIAALLEELVPACRRVAADTDGPATGWADEAGWIVRLAELNPGDRGVVIAVLLNLVHLEPGQSMFLGAGQIHTYLHGTGVEILANSDNVLRGGLTGKHVDVPELMRVLDMGERAVVPVDADPCAPGVFAYPSSVPDFRLWRLEPAQYPIVVPGAGPRLVVCTAGAAQLLTEAAGDTLGQGAAVFVPDGTNLTVTADPGPERAAGPGAAAATVFVAAANL